MRERIRAILKDETGSVSQMTWVIGSALVTALIIVGALVYAPQTAETFWNAATNFIRSSLGF
ncbi:MAG: hypothetical protein ACOYU7_10135 [Bacillota bacterium]